MNICRMHKLSISIFDSSGASSSPGEAASSSIAYGFPYRRRALGSEDLDPFGAAGGRIVGERGCVEIAVEIGIGELGADSQPAGTDARVAAEQMQTSSAQAEMLDDVENLDWFVVVAERLLLRNDQIDVDVCVDKVAVGGPPDGALDAHQAVLLGPLEDRLWLEDLGMAGIVDVRANPANVLAPPKAPLP